jgi:hypothetical protein
MDHASQLLFVWLEYGHDIRTALRNDVQEQSFQSVLGRRIKDTRLHRNYTSTDLGWTTCGFKHILYMIEEETKRLETERRTVISTANV